MMNQLYACFARHDEPKPQEQGGWRVLAISATPDGAVTAYRAVSGSCDEYPVVTLWHWDVADGWTHIETFADTPRSVLASVDLAAFTNSYMRDAFASALSHWFRTSGAAFSADVGPGGDLGTDNTVDLSRMFQ